MNLTKLSLDALWTLLDSCTHNPTLRSRIETEIHNRIPVSSIYYREYLYSVNKVGKKALILYFTPGTESLIKYGRKVIVNLILDSSTETELNMNYSSVQKIRTHGLMKADILTEGFTEDQRNKLRTRGFSTIDIMFCEWE